MPRIRTTLVLLVGLLAGYASAFTHPFQPPPLRRQNAMRMSYSKQPLPPPGDDELETLERRLPPSIATLLRLASTLAMGTAYLASPVMGTCVRRFWCCCDCCYAVLIWVNWDHGP